MRSKHRTNTSIGVGLGIALQVASTYVSTPFGAILLLAGYIAFIFGCSEYARGKGYSAWFGALGLLSIVGLIGLALMPDPHKQPPLPA